MDSSSGKVVGRRGRRKESDGFFQIPTVGLGPIESLSLEGQVPSLFPTGSIRMGWKGLSQVQSFARRLARIARGLFAGS